MFGIREKLRSVSVPHDQNIFSKKKSKKPKLETQQSELRFSNLNSYESINEYPNFRLPILIEYLFDSFPLYFQHRHSRYLCQIYHWAYEQQLYEPCLLFTKTPTSFLSEAQNVNVVLEEFLFEMKKTTPDFDKRKYTYLVERFPNDEMRICGPNEVIFKPLKIIFLQNRFQILKATLNLSINLPQEKSSSSLLNILKVTQQQNLFYQFFGILMEDQLNSTGKFLLFRETNTPIAKLLQTYLVVHGGKYLKESILPLIQKSSKKQRNYEINPVLLDDISTLDDRIMDLESLAGSLLTSIFESTIPAPIAVICSVIKYHIEAVGIESDVDTNLRSLAVGFFLHFLCPVFVDPLSVGLNISLTKNTKRGLILCAKLFQTLANGNRFEVGYMQSMNSFLDRYSERFVKFCAGVVESGNNFSPYVFKLLSPSTEFDLWWNIYCFVMQNRVKIFNLIENCGKDEIIELQKQLFVANQYLLDLYRQYSKFWKTESHENLQEYQEAWKEWETHWKNEKEGKLVLKEHCEKPKLFAISFTSQEKIQVDNIPLSKVTSIDKQKNSKKQSKNSEFVVEYPRNNDMIESFLPEIENQKINLLNSPLPFQKKNVHSWKMWNRKLYSSTPTSPTNSTTSYNTSIAKSISNFSIVNEKNVNFTIFPNIRQISNYELKKLEKVFINRLKNIDGSSPIPLFIEHNEYIIKHVQVLCAQTKSTFYTKLLSHLSSWDNRFGKRIQEIKRGMASLKHELNSMYPKAIQPLIDCRDTILLEFECRYQPALEHPEIFNSFTVATERAVYTPAFTILQYFYQYIFQEADTKIAQNFKLRIFSQLIEKKVQPFQVKTTSDYFGAILDLQQLRIIISPTEKLLCISKVIRYIYLSLFRNTKNISSDKSSLELICFKFGATEVILVLAYLLVAANISNLYSEMKFMQDNMVQNLKDKDLQYYFIIFQLAIVLLHSTEMNEESLQNFCLQTYSSNDINK